MNEVTVEKRIYIEADPQMCFSFFTNQKLIEWLGEKVVLEPKVGGEIYIDKNGKDIVSGRILKISQYSRIIFTWGWVNYEGHPPGSSIVEISFSPESKGSWLSLKHSKIPAVEESFYTEGWDHFLHKFQEIINELA